MHVFYVFKAILVILINKVRAVLNLDDNLLETAGRSCLHFLVVLCSIFLAAPLKLRVQKSETQFKPIVSSGSACTRMSNVIPLDCLQHLWCGCVVREPERERNRRQFVGTMCQSVGGDEAGTERVCLHEWLQTHSYNFLCEELHASEVIWP